MQGPSDNDFAIAKRANRGIDVMLQATAPDTCARPGGR